MEEQNKPTSPGGLQVQPAPVTAPLPASPFEQTKLLKDADSRNVTIIESDQSGKFQRAYCFLCGKPTGWVSKESSAFVAPEHVVVTCDACDLNIIAKFGDLPMSKIPTEFFDAFGYKPEIAPAPAAAQEMTNAVV
jgi:hypothetical protein